MSRESLYIAPLCVLVFSIGCGGQDLSLSVETPPEAAAALAAQPGGGHAAAGSRSTAPNAIRNYGPHGSVELIRSLGSDQQEFVALLLPVFEGQLRPGPGMLHPDRVDHYLQHYFYDVIENGGWFDNTQSGTTGWIESPDGNGMQNSHWTETTNPDGSTSSSMVTQYQGFDGTVSVTTYAASASADGGEVTTETETASEFPDGTCAYSSQTIHGSRLATHPNGSEDWRINSETINYSGPRTLDV